MKKKRLLCIGIIVGILGFCIGALWYLTVKGFGFSIGRCLISQHGHYLMVVENSPIKMSNQSKNKELFSDLESGDKILVLHDGVNESYPGSTGAYAVIKLGDGEISDIPEQVIKQLTELGWLGSEENQAVNQQEEVKLVHSQAHQFEAQYIRTNGYYEGIIYPQVKVIRSLEELNAYYERNKNTYDLERKEKAYSDTTIGFLDCCDKYDADYFKEHILILALLEEGSGSIRHKVLSVETTDISGEDSLIIRIEREVPEIGTDDMAEWHILIEPEAGVHIHDDSKIVLYIDGKEYLNDDMGRENRVRYLEGEIAMSIHIPNGWECEINENKENSYENGIYFWPKGEREGKIKLQYHKAFGVCGTGLSSEMMSVGEYEAWKGTYDNAKVWSFIVISNGTQGDYVIFNEGASQWSEEHLKIAMDILDTIVIE